MRQYSRGNKSIRTTNSGFWKARGKAKATYASRGGRIVGIKTTFVFHRQEKKPSHKINTSHTNWIMDEYRLPEIDVLGSEIRRNAAMVNVSLNKVAYRYIKYFSFIYVTGTIYI